MVYSAIYTKEVIKLITYPCVLQTMQCWSAQVMRYFCKLFISFSSGFLIRRLVLGVVELTLQ